MAEGDREDTAYLLGETRLGGWWYWYPAAALIKIRLPALPLFTLALVYISVTRPLKGSPSAVGSRL